MSPILGIIASSKLSAVGDFESIATVTVGSGGAASIEFTSIPSTYTHLQVRAFAQTNRGTYGIDQLLVRFNGDGTGSTSYAYHNLIGNGATAVAGSVGTSGNFLGFGEGSFGTSTGGTFGGGILDILDYTNTNKYTTTRSLSGVDINGTIAGYGGWITMSSGLYMNTNAITEIDILPSVGTLITQYSHFALYGIRSA